MGEQRELTDEELSAIKAKALFEAAEFKMKLAALPELAAIDADIMKIRKMETGRTVKELGLVDKQLDDIKKRQKGALLEYLKHEKRKPSGRGNSHVPTPTSQNLVMMMRAGDASHHEIAETLGLCTAMVARKYRAELDIGDELKKEGVECGIKFLGKLAYYDKGRTGSAHLYATNNSDMKTQGSVDITNSDGSLMPLVFVNSNGRDEQLDRSEVLKQLALRRGDAVEAEVVDGEVVDNG